MAMTQTAEVSPALAAALRRLRDDFRPDQRLPHDPLGLIRSRPLAEREVVAHIAALLAYGSVVQIRRAIERVLLSLGDSPTATLMQWNAGDFVQRDQGFVYRMTTAADIDALLSALAGLLQRFGSLRAAFAACDTPDSPDIIPALTRYVAMIRAEFPSGVMRGARYLTPDPATGSASKRWLLLLRWLVRADDGADLGCWSEVGAQRLLMPLDTHTARLSRWLGLTNRQTVDLRMAREVTAALKQIDPEDPMSLDMPLCHLGIARDCLHRFEFAVCSRCTLAGLCVFSASQLSSYPSWLSKEEPR
jgi:uncharacterized protein (TIGR02757 family)